MNQSGKGRKRRKVSSKTASIIFVRIGLHKWAQTRYVDFCYLKVFCKEIHIGYLKKDKINMINILKVRNFIRQ